MKKILASVSAIAMTLAMTLPASAYYNGHGNPGTTAANTTAVVVSGNNNATVNNTLNTAAATGGNTIAATGGAVNASAIQTGNAGAASNVENYVNNTHAVVVLGAVAPAIGGRQTPANTVTIGVTNGNYAAINNTLNTAAATGGNTIAATGAQNNQHHDRGNNQAAAAIYGSAITTGNGTATGAVGNYANVIVTHVTNN